VTSESNAGTTGRVEAAVEPIASKRYALAALALAQQHGDAPAWQNALRQTAEFMGDPEVKRVLENTRVGQEPKQRLIGAALNDLPVLQLNFARLLVRKNRTSLAGEISTSFDRLLEEEQGVTRARATTAVPLSDAERDALAAKLRDQTGREVILETQVDPELLGGVVVQIGDRLIDASTRAKLTAMRERLVGSL
jgi:F-type H+-transporting ATPase subunit delta